MGEWGPEAGGHALTPLAAAVLGLLAWLDLRTGRIPNAVVYPAVAGAVILSAVWPGHQPGDALLGAAVAGAGAGALRALSRGGLGGGDVKMAALVGAAAVSGGVVAAGIVVALDPLTEARPPRRAPRARTARSPPESLARPPRRSCG